MDMSEGEKLKKLLDNPVFIMHDATAKLVRAQLFFVSAATLFLMFSGVSLDGGASVLGVKIQGLSLKTVLVALNTLIFYQIVHFVWCTWDSFQEWRLRQSALGTGSWGGTGLEVTHDDPVVKARNNTLYAFLTHVLHTDLNNLEGGLANVGLDSDQKELTKIAKALEQINDTFEGERVAGDSLLRFDRWFRRFCASQNWRWLALETLLPIILGVVTFVLATLMLCEVI